MSHSEGFSNLIMVANVLKIKFVLVEHNIIIFIATILGIIMIC